MSCRGNSIPPFLCLRQIVDPIFHFGKPGVLLARRLSVTAHYSGVVDDEENRNAVSADLCNRKAEEAIGGWTSSAFVR